MREDIRFSDGERQLLTWRFTKVAAGRWTGVREDVIGQAQVVERDGAIRLDYAAMVGSAGSKTRLQFADTVYRAVDGKIVNTASVSKFGLPVGSVRLVLSR